MGDYETVVVFLEGGGELLRTQASGESSKLWGLGPRGASSCTCLLSNITAYCHSTPGFVEECIEERVERLAEPCVQSGGSYWSFIKSVFMIVVIIQQGCSGS